VAEALAIARDVVILLGGMGVLVFLLFVLPGNLRVFVREAHEMAEQVIRTSHALERQVERLGSTLDSLRAAADTLVSLEEERLDPILENLQRMSLELRDSARDIALVTREGSRFTQDTVRQLTYYRDRVFRPVLEVASLWSGARAVMKALPVGKALLSRRRKERRDG
jgi:hypothetical protein